MRSPDTVASTKDTVVSPQSRVLKEVLGESLELTTEGAESKEKGPEANTDQPQTAIRSNSDDPTSPWINLKDLPRETWEVQYLGNNAVGCFYRKTSFTNGTIQQEAESRMRVSIQGEVLEQRVSLTTRERENGEVLEINGKLTIGPRVQTFKATISNKEMTLSGEDDKKPFQEKFPWETKFRGPFAVEQSMLRNPLAPNEIRTLKYFDPLLRKMIDGRLEASDYISTPTMLGVSRELLEVRNIAMVGEGGSQALLWVDKKGEGYKSYIPANDIQSFRTDRTSMELVASIADLRATQIRSLALAGDAELLAKKSKTLDSVTFEITRESDDPYRMFTSDVGQRNTSINAITTNVTVYRGGRQPNGLQLADEDPVDEGYLKASAYIPSTEPRILSGAQAMVGRHKTISQEEVTGLQKAKICRRDIHSYFAIKEFDGQIGTINNMRRTHQGNCVEHALFFAAHCRALEIPARIALGLKYNGSKDTPEMVFHAWVEIREGNRWIPLDSTEDLTIPGSTEEATTSIDRIKFKDTNFNSPNPYLEILNVLKNLPDIKIRVLPTEKSK